MNTSSFSGKQKQSPIANTSVQYLVLPSEPKEVTAAGRGTFGFRNRYMAKHGMIRALRQMRRNQA
jgi:hypothetical protein